MCWGHRSTLCMLSHCLFSLYEFLCAQVSWFCMSPHVVFDPLVPQSFLPTSHRISQSPFTLWPWDFASVSIVSGWNLADDTYVRFLSASIVKYHQYYQGLALFHGIGLQLVLLFIGPYLQIFSFIILYKLLFYVFFCLGWYSNPYIGSLLSL